MSAVLKITVTCDGCNRMICEVENKATAQGFADSQLHVWLHFKKNKDMDDRKPWKRTEHYCRECADGAPKHFNPLAHEQSK